MRRLTKSERVLLVILAIVAVTAWPVRRHHVRIEAWWWHLRHGEVVRVADYVVPAPKNWYVTSMGEDHELMFRIDNDDRSLSPTRGAKPRFPTEISVSASLAAFTARRLDLWSSFEGSQLRKRGVEPVIRTFSIDGEPFSCLGGQRLSQLLRPQFYPDPAVWTCQSAGRLLLMITATDADMAQVWEIVSHIHKKS